jgi:DNA-binding MltR family transcriptional regulator
MVLDDETIGMLKNDYKHFFEACKKESDRGLALVAAEFFDAALERLLLSRFAAGLKQRPGMIKPLFEGFGPLSTFSAKISACFAMELLDAWKAADLDLVRRIRNEFAHSLEPRAFSDPKIGKMVGRLEGLTKLSKETEHRKILEGTIRQQFTWVCVRMSSLLQLQVVVSESKGPEEMMRLAEQLFVE